jgi:ketosteroid isomerase-like protein
MFGLILQVILTAAIAIPASQSADVTQELRARDQALLDAIAPGEVKLWDAALAGDAVYVDENGTVMTRAAFLAELKPLPAGSSGKITISAYSARLSGDVATIVHTDDEEETFHGQHLTAQYLMTETWRRQDGGWKLLLVHAYSVLKEPKFIVLPPAELEAYVGRYTAAQDLVYIIKREGDHLLGQREGGPNVALKTEVRDVFFVSGQLRTRKIFERNSSGRVVGFVDRREGSDLAWRRLP